MATVAKKTSGASCVVNPSDITLEELAARVKAALEKDAAGRKELEETIDLGMHAACRDLKNSLSLKKLNCLAGALSHEKNGKPYAALIKKNAASYFGIHADILKMDKATGGFYADIDDLRAAIANLNCAALPNFSDFIQGEKDKKKAARAELREKGMAAGEDLVNALPRIEKLLTAYEKEFLTGCNKDTELPANVRAMKDAVRALINGNWD